MVFVADVPIALAHGVGPHQALVGDGIEGQRRGKGLVGSAHVPEAGDVFDLRPAVAVEPAHRHARGDDADAGARHSGQAVGVGLVQQGHAGVGPKVRRGNRWQGRLGGQRGHGGDVVYGAGGQLHIVQRVDGVAPVDLLLGPQQHTGTHELFGGLPFGALGVQHRHVMRVALGQRGQLQCGRARQCVAVGPHAVGRRRHPERAGGVLARLRQGEGLVGQQVAGHMGLQGFGQRRAQARIARIQHGAPAVALGELLQHGVGRHLGHHARLRLGSIAQVDPGALHVALLGGCDGRGLSGGGAPQGHRQQKSCGPPAGLRGVQQRLHAGPL